MREDIISLFEKGTFPFKGNVFKTKEQEKEEIKEKTKEEEKEQDFKNLLNILRINQRGKTINCLKIIFILQYPVF